jgi:ElaB/YqjD/DUF883 family membrane-anchored ribosome-binding protein
MQTQRTADQASTPQSSGSTFATSTAVPQRSARRATARRASSRRATARQRKDDVEGRIDEYVQDHPDSTIGDIAKRLNVDRATIAAERANIVRAGDSSTG